MPMQSQAERAAMHAAASGHSTLGIPKSVGKRFVAHDQGGKLPAHVHPLLQRRHLMRRVEAMRPK